MNTENTSILQWYSSNWSHFVTADHYKHLTRKPSIWHVIMHEANLLKQSINTTVYCLLNLTLQNNGNSVSRTACPPWWHTTVGLNPYTKLQLHKHTHIYIYLYLMARFLLSTLLCAFVVLFICKTCTPPFADMCLVLHHYTEWRGSYNFWANQTLLDVQICLQCCCNSSQAVSLTLAAIHTQIACTESKKTTTTKKSKSIYCNLQWAPSCVELRLTPVCKNMKHFGISGGEERWNPLRSPAFGLYGGKNSPILHFYQKQLKQARIYNWM